MSDSLSASMLELAQLLEQATILAAPFDTEIKALEIQKADTLAALNWQIDNLKAIIKGEILALRRSVKIPRLTASYVVKETWNDEQLREIAKEIPSILQCLRDTPYVTIRYSHPNNKNEDAHV